MDRTLSLDFEKLDAAAKSSVNESCEEFEDLLRQGSGIRAEDHLGEAAEPLRLLLFRELLLLECEYRFRRLEPVSVDELVCRLSGDVSLAGELLVAARTSALAHLRQDNAQPDHADIKSWLEASGRFRIRGVLGQGGFGIVFHAAAPDLGGEVAIKAPLPSLLFSEEFRQRFLHESQAASSLDHPNIVRVLETGEAGPLCYIVSAYVPGPNLAEWLRKQAAGVNARSAAEFVRKLALAIHYAHQCDVLHCDLKPANVILDTRKCSPHDQRAQSNGDLAAIPSDLASVVPMITDFGLARLAGNASHLTESGLILGTPLYMAPEQVKGGNKRVSPKTDIYSLGVILYELLSGRTPYAPGPIFEVLYQVVHHEPPSPKLLQPGLSRKLETICLKCLEKDPVRRYSTAEELADDLGSFLDGRPIIARPVSVVDRGRRWCRRRPLIASLVAALALPTLGVFTGIVLQLRQTEVARREAETALRSAEAARRDAETALHSVDTARGEAEASEAQVHELLNELLLPSPDVHVQMMGSRTVPDLGVLRRAEAHFLGLLQRRPDDMKLRVSLTNVEISLSRLYTLQGQTDQVEATLQSARTLWENLVQQDPSNPQYLTWLAAVYFRQIEAALSQGHVGQSIRLHLQLYTLSQALADEQPGNDDAYIRILGSSSALLGYRSIGTGREEILPALQEEKALIEKLIGEDAAGTVDRKRLALVYLVLGEVSLGQGRSSEALAFWREAYKQYTALARRQPDELLVKLNLALCCSRLMAKQASDSYYKEAVAMFEQGADRLAALTRRNPPSHPLRVFLMDTYCCLAVCHWRAGQKAQAEQTFEQRVQPFVAESLANGIESWQGILCLQRLVRAGDMLQEARPAALMVARQAAMLAERLADSPSGDMAFCEGLTGPLLNASAVLCRLGDPQTALRLAEQARSLSTGLRRAAPTAPHYGHELSDAWQRIGKARWELGRREEALAAFRETAVVERQILEQAPSVELYRVRLSRCYGWLAYYGGLAGDRPAAAAALLERQRLWPDDAKELQDIAHRFEKLAEAVGKGRKQLLAEEQAERQRYLTESQRAVAASRQAAISRLPP